MTILKMSIMASILIILITIIRMIAINKLPKKVFIVLWSIVLCRLLIPLFIPSQISVPPALNGVVDSIADSKLVETLMISPLDRMTASIPIQSEKIIEGGYLSSIAPYVLIWLVGFIFMVTFFLVTHLRHLKEYKTALPIDQPFIKQWLSEHSRRIEIRQSDKIISPLTYGIWRPVILLPKAMDYTDTTRLKYVLTHELIHIKRFDMLAKYVLVAVLCIHWFNPLVWLMYILANRDLELSCDEAVVRSFGESKKTFYALALISMAESRSKWVSLYNNFSKNSLEERIVAIMKIHKSNLLGAILVITLVLVTMFATSVDSAKDLRNLSLFEHVDTIDDVSEYPSEINDVYSRTALATTGNDNIYTLNTIFTDRDVYVLIGIEGNVLGDLDINGRIVTEDEQIVYELDGTFKEIGQEEELRYFFYTGNMPENISFTNKEFTKKALLEIGVNFNETEYQFHMDIENISQDMLIFQPEADNDESDYYETIYLMSDGLSMFGSSEKSTEELVQPGIEISIVLTNGTEISLISDTRGSISDEGFPVHSTYGHNSDTGMFSNEWRFRGWELDMSEIAALIIDGIKYCSFHRKD